MSSLQNADGAVSLIIPCYNAAAYIGQAIESALAQTVPPDEIIVVDDGSIDASAEVIARYSKRVRYVRQENRGDPSARNLGLSMVSSPFVAFLDADDLWPADSLALRLDLMRRSPGVAFAYGATEQFVSPDYTGHAESAVPPPILAPLAAATLFKSEAFARIGAFASEFRLGSMMDWYSRAQHHGVRGSTCPDVVLRRRIHASNSVHDIGRLKGDYLRALRSAARRNKASTQ